jgi:hypothetical protein
MQNNDLKLLKIIKQNIFDSETYHKVCKEKKVDPEMIFLAPMAFANLDVSARTQHGIIFFNTKLRSKPQEIDHYMIHEITHFFQQCFGKSATQGSNDSDDYLSNPYEVEGFNAQTAYIAEDDSVEEAHEYIDQVLDHHDVPESKKRKKKEKLLDDSLADDKFDYKPMTKKELDDYVNNRLDEQKIKQKGQMPLLDQDEFEARRQAKRFRKKIIDNKEMTRQRPGGNQINPFKLSKKSIEQIKENIENIQKLIEGIK